MATQVSFTNISTSDRCLWFKFNELESFSVKSFNDGVIEINEIYNSTIDDFAKYIANCFKDGSNFYGLKAIEFEFNGVHVSVTEENADPEKIVQLCNKKMQECQMIADYHAVQRMQLDFLNNNENNRTGGFITAKPLNNCGTHVVCYA